MTKSISNLLSLGIVTISVLSGCKTREKTIEVRYLPGESIQGPAGPAGAKGATGPQGTAGSQTPAEGTSTGGGGFECENSRIVLKRASSEAAQSIRLMSPSVFKEMKILTQMQLADIIEKVELHPDKKTRREDQTLMLDYDEKKLTIEALGPFCTAYASVNIKSADSDELLRTLNDVKLKLIHEAGHLMNLDEERAEKFGLSVLRAMERDYIICKPPDEEQAFRETQWMVPRFIAFSEEGGVERRFDILINRPFGWFDIDIGYKVDRDEMIHNLFQNEIERIKSHPSEDEFQRPDSMFSMFGNRAWLKKTTDDAGEITYLGDSYNGSSEGAVEESFSLSKLNDDAIMPATYNFVIRGEKVQVPLNCESLLPNLKLTY